MALFDLLLEEVLEGCGICDDSTIECDVNLAGGGWLEVEVGEGCSRVGVVQSWVEGFDERLCGCNMSEYGSNNEWEY